MPGKWCERKNLCLAVKQLWKDRKKDVMWMKREKCGVARRFHPLFLAIFSPTFHIFLTSFVSHLFYLLFKLIFYVNISFFQAFVCSLCAWKLCPNVNSHGCNLLTFASGSTSSSFIFGKLVVDGKRLHECYFLSYFICLAFVSQVCLPRVFMKL